MLRIRLTSVLLLSFGLGLLAGGVGLAADAPDVQTIVNKANVMAYYQGDDGKAKVKMTITNKQGQTREREFIILRKDVKDGGDQNYFVYFQRPADVRRMVFMVLDRLSACLLRSWMLMPAC